MWAVLGLAAMMANPSRQLQIPPVNSSAEPCRKCYCDYFSQDCAGDGLRCVGSEVWVRGKVRVYNFTTAHFNRPLCHESRDQSKGLSNLTCNCACKNTANFVLETEPLPTDPPRGDCSAVRCNVGSLLVEALPEAYKDCSRNPNCTMGKWFTWSAVRIIEDAQPAIDAYGSAVDVWLYITTQSSIVECVQAEWLQMQKQLDHLFERYDGRAGQLRNCSYERPDDVACHKDARAWRDRFVQAARDVDTNPRAVYSAYRSASIEPIADSIGTITILSPLEPYFQPGPCLGVSHLKCNTAAAMVQGPAVAVVFVCFLAKIIAHTVL